MKIGIKEHYDKMYYNINNIFSKDIDEDSNKIKQILLSRKYKNIIVYMHAVPFEPMQRPQHLLRELAKSGNICFFCDIPKEKFIIQEYEKNMFVINNQEKLVFALKDFENVILYITYGMQYMYKQFLNNCKIWYDILDEPKFLANYEFFKGTYKNLVYEADIVSYSSLNLRRFTKVRKDSVYLPNAVKIDDFIFYSDEPKYSNKQLEIIENKKNNYKIVGYYGVIEDWFDNSIIESILKNPNYFIVLIGSCNIKKIKSDRVFYLDKVNYNKLKWYSALFDVAIIPFKVNKITNSVSPVKFFEYCALNIPCVSTNIKEMKIYKNINGLYLCNKKNFLKGINKAINEKNNELKEFVKNNTWQKRADIILEKINKI